MKTLSKKRSKFLSVLAGMLMALSVIGTLSLPAHAADVISGKPEAAQEAGAGEPAAAEQSENIGFPQLNVKTYASQAFWTIVSLILLYALMSKLALPQVENVIGKRLSVKDGDLNRAAELQGQAQKIKDAFDASLNEAQNTAHDTLNTAQDAANEKNAAENARFGEHARARIASAEQNIAKAKDAALQSLADISADIAAEMVQKIAGVAVNKADAKKTVTAIMQKGA